MAIVPVGSGGGGGFMELEFGSSPESIARLLGAQQQLFRSQVDQLQQLVVTQCRLTSVNPLSQEMAAGALSIKIGKRPRDLMNPKAIKYMQSIFSIKDTLGKKETREISALCGITATQVRDYFTSQRSKVRKLVRLSRENATRSDASGGYNIGDSLYPDQSQPTSKEAATHTLTNNEAAANTPTSNETDMNTVDVRIAGEYPGNSMNNNSGRCVQIPEISDNLTTAQVAQQNHVNSTVLRTIEEVPSRSTQEETIPGIDSDDKKFLENIFNLMRKEETFSGQARLMEWVLQIHNSAVLHWFLTKGGLSILTTWLSQAVVEEQTTLLLVVFRVLSHLPLHKALPVQMSAILQTVNRLRFYRTSDISNMARILLSRWSKLFVRSQALMKPSPMNPIDAQKEMLRKQRISEILSDKSWQSKIDIPEILALEGITENSIKPEPRKGQKLLQNEESSKNHIRTVSSPKTKVRRKVVLVEQPDRKSASRSVQVARVVPSNHSRPMSADDIQKAKMHAFFMQNKYGKPNASTSDNQVQKTEDCKPLPAPQSSTRLPARIHNLPQLRKDDEKASESTAETLPAITHNLPQPRRNGYEKGSELTETSPARIDHVLQPRIDQLKKSSEPIAETLPQSMELSTNSEPNSTQENLGEKLKNQCQWQTPPAIRINSLWRVGVGENSKEVAVQTQRNRREMETFYSNVQHIPPNPKEPWDLDMDYDDSLTPEILAEQPPEADAAEGSSCSPNNDSRGSPAFKNTPITAPVPAPAAAAAPSVPPVSNGAAEPDLELLAVLLKNPELVYALTSGQGTSLGSQETVALLDMLKSSGMGLAGMLKGTADGSQEKPVKPEPTSLPSPTPSEAARGVWRPELSNVTKAPVQSHFTVPVAVKSQAPALRLPQAPTTMSAMPLAAAVNSAPHQRSALNALPERLPASMPRQAPATIYPLQQSPDPRAILTSVYHHPVINTPPPRAPPVPQQNLSHNPVTFQSLRPQPSLLPEPPTIQSKTPSWRPSAANFGRQDSVPDSRIALANGMLEVPAPSSHFPINQGGYNMYPKGHAQPSFAYPGQAVGRNSSPVGPVLETWSPESSPTRRPEFQPDYHRNFTDQRRERPRDHRSEWSVQWNSGHGHPDRNRERERSRDRDRERDRPWPGGRRWRDRERGRK